MRTGFDAKQRRPHYTPDAPRDSIHLPFEFVASIGVAGPIGPQSDRQTVRRDAVLFRVSTSAG